MNKISNLKTLDKLVGKTLVAVLSRTTTCRRRPLETIKTILIIRPGGIGDAVLLLPAISALRQHFPDASIDILCEKRNAGIFGLVPVVNSIYLYDRGLDLSTCLRKSYDAVIDTEQWHRLSAAVAYVTRASIRVGFNTNERGNLFTHPVPYSHDMYEVNSFFDLVAPLLGYTPMFETGKPFVGTILPFPHDLLSDSSRLIAIFPGASVKERRWGGDNFGRTAKALNDRGYRIVVLGSHADRVDGAAITAQTPESIDLTGKTSLEQVAAILMSCAVLITADSGLLHLAHGVGIPTVSLFGSGIENKWAPRGGRHAIINRHLECSPCTRFGYTPACPRNVECLSLITVDEVVEAAVKLFKHSEQR